MSAILDFALRQNQSFILDGTLSNFRIADENIAPSLKRKRYVQLLYDYLSPEMAWEFVRAREKIEGRTIPPKRFAEQYFTVRQYVNRLKQKYGNQINVDLLLKDIDGTNRLFGLELTALITIFQKSIRKQTLKSLLPRESRNVKENASKTES